MTIVAKYDGVLTPLVGVVQIQKMVTTRLAVYADGRQVEEECAAYPVTDTVDVARVETLLDDGTWTEADLAPYGLKVAVPFTVPQGKRIIGSPSYIEDGDAIREVYDTEDVPPPPPPPTAEEKLLSAGLTPEEFDAMVAASIARRAKV
jgi:hypothetical protein